MKAADRAVAFVALGHKILAARIPMRVLPEDRNLGADIMRRVQPAFPQNMRGHGGSGRFAMHSRDQNSALIAHHRSKSFRPSHHRLGGAAGCRQNWVLLLNGRGVND